MLVLLAKCPFYINLELDDSCKLLYYSLMGKKAVGGGFSRDSVFPIYGSSMYG
jgi:competence transcription factor ComK